MYLLPIIDVETAKEKARTGNRDGAIEMLRGVLEHEFSTGDILHRGTAVSALVETLLGRGTESRRDGSRKPRSTDSRPYPSSRAL